MTSSPRRKPEPVEVEIDDALLDAAVLALAREAGRRAAIEAFAWRRGDITIGHAAEDEPIEVERAC